MKHLFLIALLIYTAASFADTEPSPNVHATNLEISDGVRCVKLLDGLEGFVNIHEVKLVSTTSEGSSDSDMPSFTFTFEIQPSGATVGEISGLHVINSNSDSSDIMIRAKTDATDPFHSSSESLRDRARFQYKYSIVKPFPKTLTFSFDDLQGNGQSRWRQYELKVLGRSEATWTFIKSYRIENGQMVILPEEPKMFRNVYYCRNVADPNEKGRNLYIVNDSIVRMDDSTKGPRYDREGDIQPVGDIPFVREGGTILVPRHMLVRRAHGGLLTIDGKRYSCSS